MRTGPGPRRRRRRPQRRQRQQTGITPCRKTRQPRARRPGRLRSRRRWRPSRPRSRPSRSRPRPPSTWPRCSRHGRRRSGRAQTLKCARSLSRRETRRLPETAKRTSPRMCRPSSAKTSSCKRLRASAACVRRGWWRSSRRSRRLPKSRCSTSRPSCSGRASWRTRTLPRTPSKRTRRC